MENQAHQHERSKRKAGSDLSRGPRAVGSESQREIYIRDACQGDLTLRAKVEGLLRASAEAESVFADSNTVSETAATIKLDLPVEEITETVVGRYKLLQKIGEGGMGVVYMADQTEPVVRKVALKIIKLGMDTKQIVARFEAECQALAMMDHPNIAKVLYAGATDTGRPYLSWNWSGVSRSRSIAIRANSGAGEGNRTPVFIHQ